jgi:ribosome biogenesis GTPase
VHDETTDAEAGWATVLGWDGRWAEALAAAGGGGLAAGRVVGVDRGALDVLAAQGLTRLTLGGALLAVVAADASAAPCSGDWCGFAVWPDGRRTVEAVLPRRTALVRARASGESSGQVLAANIDRVLVTVSLVEEPNLGRVERLVALAWESGAEPVVVLTKADRVSDAAAVASDVAGAAPGVEVLVTSSVTGEGVDRVRALATAGRTLALVGRSGAGKSTLVNALAGSDVARTADLGAHAKGRHTTVRRDLLVLPGGALIVDTPGLRGIGVIDLEEGLERVFPEIEALSADCRFADCAHAVEPGCAVLAAVEGGELDQRRLDSYRRLEREARWIARRGDARLRAEERRRWAQVTRSARSSGAMRS